MGAPALRPAGPRHPRVSESHGHTTAYSAHGRAATHALRARTIPTTRREYGSSPTGSVERTTPSSSRSPDASEPGLEELRERPRFGVHETQSTPVIATARGARRPVLPARAHEPRGRVGALRPRGWRTIGSPGRSPRFAAWRDPPRSNGQRRANPTHWCGKRPMPTTSRTVKSNSSERSCGTAATRRAFSFAGSSHRLSPPTAAASDVGRRCR